MPAAASGSRTAPATPTAKLRRPRPRPRPARRPQLLLRRVWLSKDDEDGYYYGFANSTLWPLCHQVFCRPTSTRPTGTPTARSTRQFAAAVLEEAQDGPALVFVQDYHFALLPRLLKAARPDLVVAQFWHIPWPNPEKFLRLPVGEGDPRRHARQRPARLPHPAALQQLPGDGGPGPGVPHRPGAVRGHARRARDERPARSRSASIPTWLGEYLGEDWEARALALRKRHRLADRPLLVGVDRVDYTKGIPERLRAVDRLLRQHPELKGTFHFLQVGAPSRTHLPAYRDLTEEVQDLADRINWEHGTDRWRPVVFLNEHYGPRGDYAPLSDGGGLRGEFVARRDEPGGEGVRGGPRG